jgi:putative NADPH-quinone reductase
MGFPAILKGFADKVFLPGASFNLKDDGAYVPSLDNIKRRVGLHLWREPLDDLSDGRPAPPVPQTHHAIECAPGARCDYLAHYDMDHTTVARCICFLKTVERKFSIW